MTQQHQQKILNINDVQFVGMCPNILLYSDRYSKFQLAKYNVSLSDIEINNKSDCVLFINCLIYKCVEEYIQNLNIQRSTISRRYDGITKQIGSEYHDLIIRGWLFCNKIFDMLDKILVEYDEIYQNVIYYKSSYNPRLTYTLKIDAILRKKNETEVDIVTLVPHTPADITLIGMSSIDTAFVVDYMNESNLKIGTIHEISYNVSGEVLKQNSVRPSKRMIKLQKQICDSINNKKINVLMCTNCVYKNSCSINERII